MTIYEDIPAVSTVEDAAVALFGQSADRPFDHPLILERWRRLNPRVRTSAIVAVEEGQWPMEVTMEFTIVDRLLICLHDQVRNVPMAMREAGYTQDEVSAAWRGARSAGYTESTGLGMDRLTEAGRARGVELVERFVR